ncbi:phosphatase PAP2 family protein [Caldimonas brevitalea]|uniref:Membrane-associated phospholipid phosphatase n=1 Tax=Caldimonas brevitalea TaxID=413882 RepID=A0A0G3BI04_9BURK|nr:phosphatase PAP2 family protein [Caldimonas brevitalea]AKJ26986.1 membrane-associated phospholipid phosphatase [Caldimonas brevitalea]
MKPPVRPRRPHRPQGWRATASEWRRQVGLGLRQRRRLALGLALAAVAAVAASVFLVLAEAVVEGEPLAIDRALLLALRNPADPTDPLGPWWVELMMRDITALGSTAVLALLALSTLGYLLLLRKWGTALIVLCSVAGGAGASHVLKLLVQRPRPDLVPHGVPVLTLSFPSGHATSSAVVFLTLGALLASLQSSRKAAVYILASAASITALVGLSRVYLGVHWPSDVLAGWALGAGWAAACLMVSLWLRERSGQALPAQTDPA